MAPPPRIERAALALLGLSARALRAVHGERVLRAARDGLDTVFVRANRPPLRIDVDGVELRGFLRHRSFLADLATAIHEPYFRTVLVGELRPETVFVDVGAHVGLYTLLAARRAQRVVSFEADPYTARALEVNVARSGFTNVRVVAKAAADHVGTAAFWQSPGTYSSSLFRRPSMATVRRIEVEATTIDAEVGPAADLVAKIDAEGAELEVLGGITRTLAAARRAVLLVEVNPVALAEAGRSPAELIGRLRELGLTLDVIDEEASRLTPLDGDDTGSWKGNLLCRSSAGGDGLDESRPGGVDPVD